MTKTHALVGSTFILLTAILLITFLPDPTMEQLELFYAHSNKAFAVQSTLSLNNNELSSTSDSITSKGPYVAIENSVEEYFNHSLFIGHSIVYGFYTSTSRKESDIKGARFDCQVSARAKHTEQLSLGKSIPDLNVKNQAYQVDGDVSNMSNVNYIFYMMDANDVGYPGGAEKIYETVLEQLDKIKQKVPNAKIHILGPSVFSQHAQVSNETVDYYKLIHDKESELRDKGYYVVDVTKNLLDTNGYVKDSYTNSADGVHLQESAYKESWIPILTEWATNVTTKISSNAGSSSSSFNGSDPWPTDWKVTFPTKYARNRVACGDSGFIQQLAAENSVKGKTLSKLNYKDDENHYAYAEVNGVKYYIGAISGRASVSDSEQSTITDKRSAQLATVAAIGYLYMVHCDDGSTFGFIPVDSKECSSICIDHWGHRFGKKEDNQPSILEFYTVNGGCKNPIEQPGSCLHDTAMAYMTRGPKIID